MKNFNDVISGFDEVINNAKKNGTFDDMLNKTRAYAKKSGEAIEISRKKIELLDAKTKLAKAFEKYGRLQFELHEGNTIDETEQDKLVEEIIMLKSKVEFIEGEIEALKDAFVIDVDTAKASNKQDDVVVEGSIEVEEVENDL